MAVEMLCPICHTEMERDENVSRETWELFLCLNNDCDVLELNLVRMKRKSTDVFPTSPIEKTQTSPQHAP